MCDDVDDFVLSKLNLTLTHPSLKKPVVLTRAIQESDSRWFAELKSTDAAVKRLLLAKVDTDKPRSKIPICKTTSICTTLRKLRGAVVAGIRERATTINVDDDDDHSDLEIDGPPTRSTKTKTKTVNGDDVIIPKIGIIDAPSIGDIKGIRISVYLENTRALWACMDRATVDYLMDVCAYEVSRSNDVETPVKQPTHHPIKGAKWMGDKRGYCAIKRDGCRKLYKYFRADDDANCDNEDDIITPMKRRIKDFLDY